MQYCNSVIEKLEIYPSTSTCITENLPHRKIHTITHWLVTVVDALLAF